MFGYGLIKDLAKRSISFTIVLSTSLKMTFAEPPKHAAKCFAWFDLALILAFWSVNIWQLHFEWSVNEQYSYGFFVPLLALYLAYLRQETAPVPMKAKEGFSEFFLTASLIGTYMTMIAFPANGDWRILHMAQWGWSAMATMAILYARGGWSFARHFLFPIVFMAVAVPWPRFLEKLLINGLMEYVAAGTVEIFNFCGYYAHQQANAIILPTGTVNIAEACSGVRSFQSTLMGGLFLGEMFALRYGPRFILVALACGLAFMLNIGRTFWLTYIAYTRGVEQVQTWHDPAGYLIFFVSFSVLFILAWAFYRTKPMVTKRPEQLQAYENPGIGKLSALLLAILAIASMPLSYGWYEWRSKDAVFQPTWEMDWDQVSLGVNVTPLEHALQSILFTDKGLKIQWAEENVGHWLIYHMEWATPEGGQISGLHNPGNCLTSVGWNLLKSYEVFEWKEGGVTLMVAPFAFALKNETVYVFDIQWDPSGYPYHETQGLRIYTDRFSDIWHGNRKPHKRVIECIGYNFPTIESAQQHFKAFLGKAFRSTSSI